MVRDRRINTRPRGFYTGRMTLLARRLVGMALAVAMCATPGIVSACLAACAPAAAEAASHAHAVAEPAGHGPHAQHGHHAVHGGAPEEIPTAALTAACDDCCPDADPAVAAVPVAPGDRSGVHSPVALVLPVAFHAPRSLTTQGQHRVHLRPPAPPTAPLVLRI